MSICDCLCTFLRQQRSPVKVEDDALLLRHHKRLQEELAKQTPDLTVVKELMDAEFFSRRKWITKLDVRTRIRETLVKFPLLVADDQVL